MIFENENENEKEVSLALLELKNIIWESNIFTLSFNISIDNEKIRKIFLNKEIYFIKKKNIFYIQKFIFNNNYNICKYYIIIYPQELKKYITISIFKEDKFIKNIICEIINIIGLSYPKNLYPNIFINESIWLEENLKFILNDL
jgi:hypothetical protein